MILHDPILVPHHLTFDFEQLCDTSFVTISKYEEEGDGISRYTMKAESALHINNVFEQLNALGEYQREYDHYNSQIRNYVWQYRFDLWKRYAKLVIVYLILLFI